MKGLIAILVPLLVLNTAAQARSQANQVSDCVGGDHDSCRYILAATAAFTGMLTTGDPTPLRRYLSTRALWVSSGGEVRSGAELIEAVIRDTRRATASLEHAEVRFFGDVAIVTWRESWTAPDTAVKAGRLAGVDTWVRQGGRWMVVATAETGPAP